MWRKGNTCTLLATHCWVQLLENSMDVFQKTKNRTTMIQQFHSCVYIQLKKKKKNTNVKRYMHPNVHSSIIYNCQDMEAN